MQSQKSKVKSQKSKIQILEQQSVGTCRLVTGSWLLTAGSSGFTLLEVLVAMAILAVALVSLLGLYNRSLTTAIRAQRLSTATLLAQEMLTRTQLEGAAAAQVTSGDFSVLHPGQYPEFRWRRTIRPTPLSDLWELHVGVFWGERPDESCELTLFTPLEGS
ncbi:MAG TPA: prepilin-type N-terminal cleavage/methylation domain-containing protein [Methylomirabilota bacterium]|jgi:general secretion pathway protein I|nr:prepilin-type N-terminal cleavage/methylation domain-containing protein [Methylomirabilota bacterium]